mmetsp:Transcript_27590/g.78028  ORF Transcript_27590/g.78028 Transcript_27590/m.78028 type:complete len:98 (-) Transcript_27590:95-388(-)
MLAKDLIDDVKPRLHEQLESQQSWQREMLRTSNTTLRQGARSMRLLGTVTDTLAAHHISIQAISEQNNKVTYALSGLAASQATIAALLHKQVHGNQE